MEQVVMSCWLQAGQQEQHLRGQEENVPVEQVVMSCWLQAGQEEQHLRLQLRAGQEEHLADFAQSPARAPAMSR